MKLGIQSRLFIAFIGTIALVVAAMALAVNWGFQRGLEDYLRQVELEHLDQVVDDLSQAYGEHGSWEFLRHNPRAWHEITDRSMGRSQGTAPEGGRPTDRLAAESRRFPPRRPPPWQRPTRGDQPPLPPRLGERPFRPAPPNGPPPRPGDDEPPPDFDQTAAGDFPPGMPPPPLHTRAAPPPGVPDQALPQLFERLYRVDKSRSRDLGGAGLGLAICRNIVAAHGGRIEAAHSTLGGLALHIHLPTGGGKTL